MASVLLEARPYRPFKSSEEYLEAMREDLAEWLNIMYPELMINADNFMDRLDTGVALCKHANNVRQAAEDYLIRRQARNKSMTRSMTSGLAGPILAMGNIHYLPAAKSGTFFARDNVSNFITWCRRSLKIFECLLFETDDLIMRKNEKHVILCLLEVARQGAKFGMLAPMLIQMERQIDREIAADTKADSSNGTKNVVTETEFDTDTEDEDDHGPMLMYGPQPQIITNDLKSLDEMVRDLVEKCTCPSQFPMIRVSEGKYRIGDTKVLIFVRILRSHVMVRVGGGWDTLSHYLDKHDPCRCRSQHRSSVAARLIPRTNSQTNGIELHKAQVIFERSPPVARRIIPHFAGNSTSSSHLLSGNNNNISPPKNARGRSRSPTPQRQLLNNSLESTNVSEKQHGQSIASLSSSLPRRSISPSPRRFANFKKKQTPLESEINLCLTKTHSGVDLGSHVHFENLTSTNNDVSNKLMSVTNSTVSVALNVNFSAEASSKFDSISDNGSEISDEGYRSLGLVQSVGNFQNRESLQSETTVEDAVNNMRLDQTLSDSQISPSDEQSSINKTPDNLDSNCTDLLDTLESITPSPPEEQSEGQQSTKVLPQEMLSLTNNIEELINSFEQSGVFITDDEITVDIASATGLRKTGFSDKIYGNSANRSNVEEDNSSFRSSPRKFFSKIPRSPVPTRRCSVDISDCGLDFTTRTGLPILNRKLPAYKSVRKPSSSLPLVVKQAVNTSNTTTNKGATIIKPTISPLPERKSNSVARVKDVTSTWSGRSSVAKRRSSITSDTFTFSTSNNFTRNSKGRYSAVLYDSNGRRVKGGSTSLTTSPTKNNVCTSPLAQQLLDAAGTAKNDAQILEKMKQLLTQYSGLVNNSNSSNNNKFKKSDYDDFTTAWVHSNGTLDRSSTSSQPIKGSSKRSSAASSTESTHSKDQSVIISSRKDQGLSRIPAPVRNHTDLY